MRKHLSDIIDGRKQPVVPWTQAVERFNKAVRAETQCRKEVAGISKLPASISGLITDSELHGINWRASSVSSWSAMSCLTTRGLV